MKLQLKKHVDQRSIQQVGAGFLNPQQYVMVIGDVHPFRFKKKQQINEKTHHNIRSVPTYPSHSNPFGIWNSTKTAKFGVPEVGDPWGP